MFGFISFVVYKFCGFGKGLIFFEFIFFFICRIRIVILFFRFVVRRGMRGYLGEEVGNFLR